MYSENGNEFEIFIESFKNPSYEIHLCDGYVFPESFSSFREAWNKTKEISEYECVLMLHKTSEHCFMNLKKGVGPRNWDCASNERFPIFMESMKIYEKYK
jgi:hypothetical protein